MTAVSLMPSGQQEADFDNLMVVFEKLARSFQEIFSQGTKIEAKAGPITHARYPEWRISQNPFGILLRYAPGTTIGDVVIHIPGNLINQIIDIAYGGNGQIATRGSFSHTEIRFIERLANKLLPLLGMHASDGIAPQSRLLEMQTDILAFQWPKSCDQIVVASIFVECPDIKSATISCFMNVATAKQIIEGLSEKQAPSADTNPVWKAKMHSAALRVHLPARAVLTRAEFPASRLLSLAPGDILPILLPNQVPLTVAGRPFARGTIGEANGRAALKIEHIEGSDHE